MLPQLRRLEARFADQIEIIGVHSAKFPAERESANLRAAVDRLELHHPVVNDGEFHVWNGFAVRAWPTLMFVDPDGRVFGKHEGEFPEEPVAEMIAEVLADRVRDRLFIADTGHHRVVQTDLTGEVTTAFGDGKPALRDGDARSARFWQPRGMALSPDGDTLYVADSGNHTIRAIALSTGN